MGHRYTKFRLDDIYDPCMHSLMACLMHAAFVGSALVPWFPRHVKIHTEPHPETWEDLVALGREGGREEEGGGAAIGNHGPLAFGASAQTWTVHGNDHTHHPHHGTHHKPQRYHKITAHHCMPSPTHSQTYFLSYMHTQTPPTLAETGSLRG